MGLKWIATYGSSIPSNAVEAGFERNGTALYVARAMNSRDGQWTPGKASHYLRDGCHFPYGGDEHISYNYEVLTRDNGMSSSPSIAEWRNSSSTFRAVCTSPSDGLFVARGFYKGSLIPGKFDNINRGCYVSYGGKEYSCNEYQILYEKAVVVSCPPSSAYNAPTLEGTVTKLQHHFYGINTSLQKGLGHLAEYVKKVKLAFEEKRDFCEFIKNIIYPPVNLAKEEFNSMCEQADRLVAEVNKDVESCVQEVANKERTIRNLDKEINRLMTELDGKKREIDNAQERLRRKQGELAKAEEALQIARNKLHEAKKERKTAKIVGGLLFLLGPIGWAAGATALSVDATTLKNREQASRENRDDAIDEVWSSKQSLDEAKRSRWKTENELTERRFKKQAKENYLSDLRKAVDGLRRYQRNISGLNENVKNLNKELTEFCGKFEVFHVETDGGYLLELLKKPTDNVLDALKKLGETEAITLICSPTEVEELNASMREVENIQWPTAAEIDNLI